MADLKKWLDEEIAEAKENAAETARITRNPYRAGCDTGWLYALERVRLKLDDKLDT